VEIDYNLIVNKLTEKGICKFFDSQNIKSEKCPTKQDLKDRIAKLTSSENSLFQFVDNKDLIEFYLKTEEAGQKHFYFYEFEMTQEVESRIESFKKECSNDTKREFNTTKNEEWFFREEKSEITFKLLTIKKTYRHNKDLDKEDNNKFFKGYDVFEIQNVLFFRFFKDINRVLIGIDKHSDLDREKDIQNRILENFNKICGEDQNFNLENILDDEIIEELMYLPNVLISKIKNDVNQTKQSSMYAKRVDVEKVLEAVNKKTYHVDEIKAKNPDYDIRTHPTYLAERNRKYEDDTLEVDINGLEIYWFSHLYSKADYFRVRLSSIDSSIVTYSSSITKEEIEDVIQKIIRYP
jgi:hypothetical protein